MQRGRTLFTFGGRTLVPFYHARGKFGFLSNFAPGRFVGQASPELPPQVNHAIDGVEFPTAEHAIMAAKAGLFEDDETLQLIKSATTPLRAKHLGRSVRGFDEEQWRSVRATIARVLLTSKFSQVKHHGDVLRSTLTAGAGGTPALIAETSPTDAVWGIGMSTIEALNAAKQAGNWQFRGENLLGETLMQVARLI